MSDKAQYRIDISPSKDDTSSPKWLSKVFFETKEITKAELEEVKKELDEDLNGAVLKIENI